MPRTSFAFTGAQSDADVLAAQAGKVFRILRLHFTTSAAATVAFSDGADATASRIVYGDFAANGGMALDSYGQQPNMYPVALLTKGNALKVTTSAGNLKGVVEYAVES